MRTGTDFSCEDKVYDATRPDLARYFHAVSGKRALDIGCGTGRLGAALREQGNECYGITISQQEAELAEARLTQVVVGDIEGMEALPFPRGFFDVVIFADVLEHLRRPDRVLELVKPHLRAGALLIASIPNIANIVPRLNLLRGRFDYEPFGILDHTHLRFYTKRTAEHLLTQAGYRILDVKFTDWNWQFPKLLQRVVARYEWEIRQRLTRWCPGLLATQFIFSAEWPGPLVAAATEEE